MSGQIFMKFRSGVMPLSVTLMPPYLLISLLQPFQNGRCAMSVVGIKLAAKWYHEILHADRS
jgi:hypothetical protein